MAKRINLALQGGGAHGAFTWGVLDRLLDEPEIEVAAISGTSAGALNGAAFKSGIVSGGREGARRSLDWLWGEVAGLNDFHLADWMVNLAPPTAMLAAIMEASAPFQMMDAVSRVVSPYAAGPLYANPLQSVVDQFEYDKVCDNEGPALFICATDVRSGKIRVFTGPEIGTDAILASACLPTLFQAVGIEKDGKTEYYWDGGYTGNPALFPLFSKDFPDDILVININPIERREVPHSPQQIVNRINEISFNSSLLRELRAIGFVQRLLEQGRVPPGAMKHVLVHLIADDGLMNDLSVATKMIASPVIIARLKAAGRTATDRFIADHMDDLNERSTLDLAAIFG